MSAAWDAFKDTPQSEKSAKRMIRLWGMLSFAGAFLVFVAMRLGIRLF